MDPFSAKIRQSSIMRSGRRQKKDGKKSADKGVADAKRNNGEQPQSNDESLGNINIKHNRDSRNCWITGMKFVENGDLVLVDSSNYCLKVVDVTSQRVRSYTELRYKPWDLAEFETGHVIVTCPVNKQLLFINLTNGYNYRQILVGGCCYGVIVHNSTFIVSFTHPNPEVQFLSQDGVKLKSVDIFTTGQPLFKSPRYLTMSADRASFYVSDWGNDTVFKISLTGGIEAMCTERQVKNPRGLVTQGRASVYVTGWGSSNISQVSLTCDQMDVVLTEYDGIHLPQCLAVRPKLKSSTIDLFVSQDGLDRNVISVYRLK